MDKNTCDSNKAPYCPNPSKYELSLYRLLKEIGIDSQLQYWNGKEHINLAILKAKLFIIVEDQGRTGGGNPEPVEPGTASLSDEEFQVLRFSKEEIKENVHKVVRIISGYLSDNSLKGDLRSQ